MSLETARVLIVEDEPLIAMELEDRLTRLGYSVCGSVRRGEDALPVAARFRPELALMDINLAGEINGIETAHRLRARYDIPIVYLTAYSDDSLIRAAMGTEPYGYLVKPFQERELHATLQVAIIKHRLERQLRARSEQLAVSEQFNRAILDSISGHIAVLDENGDIVATNQAWRRFAIANGLDWNRCGRTFNYLEICDSADDVHVPNSQAIAAAIRDILAGRRQTFEIEYPCHSPTERRWFLCRVTRLATDGPARVVVSHENVTAVHDAADKLAQSLSQQAALAEVAPIGILRVDTVGRVVEANRRLCEIVGVTLDDLTSGRIMPAIHPDDIDRVRKACGDALMQRSPLHIEYRFVQPMGRIVWVSLEATPLFDTNGGFDGFIGTVADISTRKQIELAMRAVSHELATFDGDDFYHAATEKLVMLMEAHQSFVCRLDSKSTQTLRWLARYGDALNLLDVQRLQSSIAYTEALAGRIAVVEGAALRHLITQPQTADMHVSALVLVPLADRFGQTIGLLGIATSHPLTNPQLMETILTIFAVAIAAALERDRNRQQYKELFEFAPDALLMVDREGCIALANRQAEALFGYSRDELCGQPIETLLPAESRAVHRMHRARFGQLPDRKRMAANRPMLSGLRKDGTIFPAEIDLSPLMSDDKMMTAVAIRDLTARKALEAQLAQAVKMEAIGKITGGLAHDFHNYLGIIIGNLDLLHELIEPTPQAVTAIDAAIAGAERAAELTQSLLAFSRRQPLDPKLVDLNLRLGTVRDLLVRMLGERIQVETALTAGLWPVKIDGAQFDSSIINLAKNARDAMPHGGRLTLSTRNTHVAQEEATRFGLYTGDFVVVEVKDTGIGIPAEQLNSVFEPFFTTKGVGHGTGLGLSMVYGFVKQSGGHVVIESVPQQGTTVRIYLPRAAEATGVMHTLAAGQLVERGDEAILVVEDNQHLRETAVAQLSALGYRVVAAADAGAALTRLGSAEDKIDLVFTDIVMPGPMSGWELAARARERQPWLKFVFTSGFSQNDAERQQEMAPDQKVLSKPYRLAELAQVIRTALDSDTAGGALLERDALRN